MFGKAIFIWHKHTVKLHVALFSPGNYMFKVNNRNTRTKSEICSKLTIKTLDMASFWCRYC